MHDSLTNDGRNQSWNCERCFYVHPDPAQDPFYQDQVKGLMYICAVILVLVSTRCPVIQTILLICSLGLLDRIVVLSSHARLSDLAKPAAFDEAGRDTCRRNASCPSRDRLSAVDSTSRDATTVADDRQSIRVIGGQGAGNGSTIHDRNGADQVACSTKSLALSGRI